VLVLVLVLLVVETAGRRDIACSPRTEEVIQRQSSTVLSAARRCICRDAKTGAEGKKSTGSFILEN